MESLWPACVKKTAPPEARRRRRPRKKTESALITSRENVRAGGSSTLFFFGQTGSGKSHSMAGVESYVGEQLFPEAQEATAAPDDERTAVAAPDDERAAAAVGGGGVSGGADEIRAYLSVFEVAGSKCVPRGAEARALS
jgi:hypothetical protein